MRKSRRSYIRELAGPLGTPPPTRWQKDVFAILMLTDAEHISHALRRLDRTLSKGIRYFSSVGRCVALDRAEQAAKEFAAIERAPYLGEALAQDLVADGGETGDDLKQGRASHVRAHPQEGEPACR